ncbi:histidine kinase [Alphaproteobacteria bacterium]|nr:histidine kinase [Alphaproteobacteria bacterium]
MAKKQHNQHWKRFSRRAFVLSLPATAILAFYSAAGQLDARLAAVGIAAIAALNVLCLLPFLSGLQGLSDYVSDMAASADFKGRLQEAKAFTMSLTSERAAILRGVNALYARWRESNIQLKDQILSDAAVIQALPTPILFLRGDGVIVSSNSAARAAFGAMVGAPIALLLPEFSLDASASATIGDRHYTVVPERLPALTEDGADTACLFIDTTEQTLARRAEQDFIAGAGHELKTPLAVMKGSLETLRAEPEAAPKFVPLMLAQADRMSKLVQDMLDLSRLDFGDRPRDAEPVNLAALVISANKIIPVSPGPIDRRLVAWGAADELLAVLTNLADNAAKYGRPGAPVTVSVAREGGWAAVCVHNECDRPIPPEALPRLTERFFRAGGKSGRSGHGLGLAIVQAIVDRHGGRLEITSSDEAGTAARVLLPIYEEC